MITYLKYKFYSYFSTRIGIMKDGEIKETDTLLRLKEKHQKGYTIEVKLENTKIVEYDVDLISKDISKQLGSEPKSCHGVSISFSTLYKYVRIRIVVSCLD